MPDNSMPDRGFQVKEEMSTTPEKLKQHQADHT